MDLISHSDSRPRDGKLILVVFAVYAAVFAFTVACHEPWMDEAQAWLLVQDTTPGELFAKYLRYEGSPGLWHLILLVPAKFGMPYFTLNVISALFAALGVWVFLRWSPFPLAAKLLFPFTYFVFFQYGVVARSYCLIPVLIFWAAIEYERKMERPMRFVLPLCLVALVSVHTFLIAGAIAAVHFLDVIAARRGLSRTQRRAHTWAFGVFAVISLAVVAVLAPPSDHFVAEESHWDLYRFFVVSSWSIPAAFVLDESSAYLNAQRIASMGMFVLTVWWLKRRGLALLYLLPMALLLALFSVKYRSFWHDGVTFLLWVAVVWIGFARAPAGGGNRLDRVMAAVVVVVFGVHAYWTFYAVRNDVRDLYSGSREAAEYLKQQPLPDQSVFATGWKNVAVQPYFDRNVFYNFNAGDGRRFWDWSTSNRTPLGMTTEVVEQITADQPQRVLIASDHLETTNIPLPDGYYLERTFFGYLFWKTGVFELNSYWLLRRSDGQAEEPGEAAADGPPPAGG